MTISRISRKFIFNGNIENQFGKLLDIRNCLIFTSILILLLLVIYNQIIYVSNSFLTLNNVINSLLSSITYLEEKIDTFHIQTC